MATSQTVEKLKSTLAVTHYDHDPDATSATDVAWVDMRDYGNVMMTFFRTVGTSALTFKIIANSESDGSGTDVTVVEYSGSEPDAVGDYVSLECSAQNLAALGTDLRYVSANLTLATGTDEGVVTYIRAHPRFAESGLTSDSIA